MQASQVSVDGEEEERIFKRLRRRSGACKRLDEEREVFNRLGDETKVMDEDGVKSVMNESCWWLSDQWMKFNLQLSRFVLAVSVSFATKCPLPWPPVPDSAPGGQQTEDNCNVFLQAPQNVCRGQRAGLNHELSLLTLKHALPPALPGRRL